LQKSDAMPFAGRQYLRIENDRPANIRAIDIFFVSGPEAANAGGVLIGAGGKFVQA
jgi:hypothetical protein